MLAVKKNVFSAVLKLSKDGELRTEHGNRFHAAGPATTNAHPPNSVLVRWTTRSPRADDRVRPSTQELAQSSDKYAGTSPLNLDNTVSRHIELEAYRMVKKVGWYVMYTTVST